MTVTRFLLLLSCLSIVTCVEAKQREIDIYLRGHEKSGTTAMEAYMTSLFSESCVEALRNFTFTHRVSTCEWENEAGFHKATAQMHDKHTVFDEGRGKSKSVLKKCGGQSPKQTTECLRSHQKEWEKDADLAHIRYVLAIREPLDTVKSWYYHTHQKSQLSQNGLNKYVTSKAKEYASYQAGRYLLFGKLLKNVTVVHFYGEGFDNVNKAFARWLEIPESIMEGVGRIAEVAASRDQMKAVEEMGNLPTGGARNGKVRTYNPYDLDDSLRKKIVCKFVSSLPSELVEKWYGSITCA